MQNSEVANFSRRKIKKKGIISRRRKNRNCRSYQLFERLLLNKNNKNNRIEENNLTFHQPVDTICKKLVA